MPKYREIRASYDRKNIVVYQAYNDVIADAAVEAGRFVEPFSYNRMTWIKPSFLWLMERSKWGTKPNQTRILAIHISRSGWNSALLKSCITSFEPDVHHSFENWQSQFNAAAVHAQWDPERSLYGKKLEFRTIQIGISRTLIQEYVSDWIQEIRDITDQTRKIRRLRQLGKYKNARQLLPKEKMYPVNDSVAKQLGMKERKGK